MERLPCSIIYHFCVALPHHHLDKVYERIGNICTQSILKIRQVSTHYKFCSFIEIITHRPFLPTFDRRIINSICRFILEAGEYFGGQWIVLTLFVFI